MANVVPFCRNCGQDFFIRHINDIIPPLEDNGDGRVFVPTPVLMTIGFCLQCKNETTVGLYCVITKLH
jgi:hypothetical protein